jgi:regulatory protein
MSEHELARSLGRAGCPAADIESTLAFLRERRYLDDDAFAQSFARSAALRKGWGPLRIARALAERRVAAGSRAAALAEVFPGGEEEALMRALGRFRRRSPASMADERGRARAYRHLLAKGFAPEAIHSVLERSARDDDRGSLP